MIQEQREWIVLEMLFEDFRSHAWRAGNPTPEADGCDPDCGAEILVFLGGFSRRTRFGR